MNIIAKNAEAIKNLKHINVIKAIIIIGISINQYFTINHIDNHINKLETILLMKGKCNCGKKVTSEFLIKSKGSSWTIKTCTECSPTSNDVQIQKIN